MRTRAGKAVAVLAALAIGLVACSSDDSDSDSGADSSDGSPSSSGPEPTGEPFLVGFVTTDEAPGVVSIPEGRVGAESAADYVNAELGGVDGRPLEVRVCDDQGDPARSSDCTQELLDQGVQAFHSLSPVWSDNGLPIAEEAGVPYFGFPNGAPALFGPTSFPLLGGPIAAFPGLGRYFAETEGVERAAVLHADIAVAAGGAQLLADTLTEYGATEVELVPASLGEADFTPAVVAANEIDPDAVFILFDAVGCSRIFQAAGQLGVTADLVASDTCLDQERVFDEVGDLAEGTFYDTQLIPYNQTDDPEVAAFVDALERYGDEVPSNLAAAAFSGIMTIREVGLRIGADAMDAASMIEFMQTVEDLDIFMGPVYSASNAPPIAPQVRNTDIRVVQLQDGEIVELTDDWISGF